MWTFTESVIVGVVGNAVFAAIVIWIVQAFRYWRLLKRRFHNREFEVYWKGFTEDMVQTITCTVDKNKIKFSGLRIAEKDTFEGEFLINPINLKMGEGFHTHLEDDNAFGFSKIIIRDTSFHIEMPYTKIFLNNSGNKEGKRVYQAFVWRRVQ